MNNSVRDNIEKRLAVLEMSAELGQLSLDEIDSKKRIIENLSKAADFSKEEKAALDNRIKSVIDKVNSDEYKYKYIPAGNVKTVKKNAKKLGLTTKIAALTLATGLTFSACGNEVVEAPSKVETNETEEPKIDEDIKVTIQDVTDTNATEKYDSKALVEDFKTFLQLEVIDKGLTKDNMITEKNKEQWVTNWFLFYLESKFDVMTDEQIANIFPDTRISAEDFMNAKHSCEWSEEERITVSNKHINYKELYNINENDGRLLNHAFKLLKNIKKSSDSERKDAIKEAKEYLRENLTDDKSNLQYSVYALDTLRAVYFDTLDEITYHAVIDDELEHAVNTASNCSATNIDLNVIDPNIQSAQSENETYIYLKIANRLDAARNFALSRPDAIDEKNDYSNIIKYVCDNIDITNVKELRDYSDALEAYYTTSTPSQSSVSYSKQSNITGKGGATSNSQSTTNNTDKTKTSNTDKSKTSNTNNSNKKYKEEDVISVEITDKKGNKIDIDADDFDEKIAGEAYNDGKTDGHNGAKKGTTKGKLGNWLNTQYKQFYLNGYTKAKKEVNNFKEEHGDETKTYEGKIPEFLQPSFVIDDGATSETYFSDYSEYTEYVPVSETKTETTTETKTETTTETTTETKTETTTETKTETTTETTTNSNTSNIDIENLKEGDIVDLPIGQGIVISVDNTTHADESSEYEIISEVITEFGYTTESVVNETKTELEAMRNMLLENYQQEEVQENVNVKTM